jgi:hypothetical protein
VDAGLHLLQGEAEFVSDLARLLEACYRDKLTDLLRHEAGARLIGQYDLNNAYQYTINREETQLSWLARAIADVGGAVPAEPAAPSPSGTERRSWRDVVEDDLRASRAFVEKWTPLADAMTHARHRKLLRVIIGETIEQKRLFEQALSGRTDLLGRRGEGTDPAVGEVLPTRWVE